MVICGCFHLFSFIYIIIVVVVLLHYIRSTPFLKVFAVTSTPLSVTSVMTPTATSLHPHTPTVRATVIIPGHTSPERGPPRSPLCSEGWRGEESTCLTRWRGFNQSCNILMSSRPCRLPGPYDVCRSLWCVSVPLMCGGPLEAAAVKTDDHRTCVTCGRLTLGQPHLTTDTCLETMLCHGWLSTAQLALTISFLIQLGKLNRETFIYSFIQSISHFCCFCNWRHFPSDNYKWGLLKLSFVTNNPSLLEQKILKHTIVQISCSYTNAHQVWCSRVCECLHTLSTIRQKGKWEEY